VNEGKETRFQEEEESGGGETSQDEKTFDTERNESC
jgi:hypothetical protein